jgi:ABC-type nickel/cobalt efflux system permease component RcnA
MQTRRHRYVVLLAIGVIVVNCFGAQGAVAAHHSRSSTIEQTVDLDSHDHAAANHDHNDSAGNGIGAAHTDKPGGVDDSSNVCCTSLNCAATGILAPEDVSPFRADANPVAIGFDDAVRTVALGTIDPPPRSI